MRSFSVVKNTNASKQGELLNTIRNRAARCNYISVSRSEKQHREGIDVETIFDNASTSNLSSVLTSKLFVLYSFRFQLELFLKLIARVSFVFVYHAT